MRTGEPVGRVGPYSQFFLLQLASGLECNNTLGWRGLPGSNTSAYLAYKVQSAVDMVPVVLFAQLFSMF